MILFMTNKQQYPSPNQGILERNKYISFTMLLENSATHANSTKFKHYMEDAKLHFILILTAKIHQCLTRELGGGGEGGTGFARPTYGSIVFIISIYFKRYE